MQPRELALLLAICCVWGVHFIVVRTTVVDVPPIFYVAVRMTLLAAIMAPFLRIPKEGFPRLLAAGLGLGAFNYAFMFSGLKYAPASAAAIAVELSPVFATVLSVVFLGERIRWRRITGIVLALCGVALVAARPAEAGTGFGVALVVAAAFSEAAGTVLAKSVPGVRPTTMLAWFSVVGVVVLWPATLLIETGQREALRPELLPRLGGALLYSVLLASVFGHTTYYWLLQRLPVSLLSPSLLITTLIGVFLGVVLLGERLTATMIVGGLFALVGVGIILARTPAKSPAAAAAEPGGP